MPDAETSTMTSTTPSSSNNRTKKLVHWQEVQDTVSRLASHKGVLAITILNSDGDIVTQQITAAGAARKSANNNNNTNDTAGGGSSSSGSNVLGNPKLLTEMMKNANKYVQSISGRNDSSNSNSNTDADETEEEPTDDEASSNTSSKSAAEEISFVRIRTQNDEILVAPKLGYTLVALQDPNLSSL